MKFLLEKVRYRYSPSTVRKIFFKLNMSIHIDMKICIRSGLPVLALFYTVMPLYDTFAHFYRICRPFFAPAFAVFDPWTQQKKRRDTYFLVFPGEV